MYTINNRRLINTFADLVRISSPSWQEHRVIDYITNTLNEMGITFKKLPYGESYNLLIRVKGTGQSDPVLFSAHTDTVLPCENIKPIIHEKKITSDGTTILGSDDKAAIAIFLEGLRIIHEEKIPHGPLEFLLTCAEEVGLQGARHMDYSRIQSKRAFVFDSDGPVGGIVVKAPYQSTMEITIHGKAAHAGMEPEKGINAIRVLSEIIADLPQGRLDEGTTLNVGTIEGGRATNIVPAEAKAKLEVRSLEFKKMKHYEKIVRDTVKKHCRNSKARSAIDYNLLYSGFSIKPGDPLLKIADSAMQIIQVKPRHITSGGGSDTNIFNKNKIKSLNLSCGMMKPHTTDEYIMIQDLVKGTELMLTIIKTIHHGSDKYSA